MADHVISSDSHVFEPADVWTARLDARWRDQAPHVVAADDADWWMCQGHKLQSCHSGGEQLGWRFTSPQRLNRAGRMSAVLPGAYDPTARLKDMARERLSGEVLYPTIGGHLYGGWLDQEFFNAACRAYNDWLADFCAVQPDRYRGLAMLNAEDTGNAVRELARARGRGLAGGVISVTPADGLRHDDPRFDSLWASAEASGMPLSLHIISPSLFGFREGSQKLNGEQETPSFRINMDYWPRMCLGHMIFGGVFERYPGLRVGVVEFEAVWAAHLVERMDFIYTQKAYAKSWRRFQGGALPSDFFHRNVFLGIQEDAMAVRLREVIGVDNLLWGSDYPHAESTFPRSQEILKEIMDGCTPEEVDKMTRENARKLYRFP